MDVVSVQMDGLKINALRYPTLFLEQIPHSTFIECNYTRAHEFFKVQKSEYFLNAPFFVLTHWLVGFGAIFKKKKKVYIFNTFYFIWNEKCIK